MPQGQCQNAARRRYGKTAGPKRETPTKESAALRPTATRVSTMLSSPVGGQTGSRQRGPIAKKAGQFVGCRDRPRGVSVRDGSRARALSLAPPSHRPRAFPFARLARRQAICPGTRNSRTTVPFPGPPRQSRAREEPGGRGKTPQRSPTEFSSMTFLYQRAESFGIRSWVL
jgi:hypothetical protein